MTDWLTRFETGLQQLRENASGDCWSGGSRTSTRRSAAPCRRDRGTTSRAHKAAGATHPPAVEGALPT
eukprot:4413551-Pyramimonas_sp.AAC.1